MKRLESPFFCHPERERGAWWRGWRAAQPPDASLTLGVTPLAAMSPAWIRLLAVIGFVLFWPAVALADNCGSLHDCWGTAGAAGSAAAGAGAAAGGMGWGGGGGVGGGDDEGGGEGDSSTPPDTPDGDGPDEDQKPDPCKD